MSAALAAALRSSGSQSSLGQWEVALPVARWDELSFRSLPTQTFHDSMVSMQGMGPGWQQEPQEPLQVQANTEEAFAGTTKLLQLLNILQETGEPLAGAGSSWAAEHSECWEVTKNDPECFGAAACEENCLRLL